MTHAVHVDIQASNPPALTTYDSGRSGGSFNKWQSGQSGQSGNRFGLLQADREAA